MISTAMGKSMRRIVRMRMARLESVLGNGDRAFKKRVYYNAGSKDSLWAFAGAISTATARQISLIGTSRMASVIGCLPFGWGNGNGTFQPETAVNLPDNIEDLGIVPGDFNSDGLLDFIMLPAAGGI
jgi:FG-GAP-like repeat